LGEEEFYEEQDQRFEVEIVKGFGGCLLGFLSFFRSESAHVASQPVVFFLVGRDFGWSGSLEARGEQKGI
jgi:hypothetical protein